METKKFYGNTEGYFSENLDIDDLEMVSGGTTDIVGAGPSITCPNCGGDKIAGTANTREVEEASIPLLIL